MVPMKTKGLAVLTADESKFVHGPSLGPTMYYCSKCKIYKYPGHYSMSSFYAPAGMVQGQPGGASRICNQCRIDSSNIRAFSRDIETPDWKQARCAGDAQWNDHFFEDDLTEGAKYCADCPIRQGCLKYGLESHSEGLWGGQLLTGNGKTVMDPEKPRQGRPLLKDTCMKGGHPWTEDSTGYDAAGKRYCMTCKRNTDTARWARKKQERADAKLAE